MREIRVTEVRSLIASNSLEIRINEDKEKAYVAGFLPTGEKSGILKDKEGKKFKEVILEGVFSKVLKSKGDKPKLLINHDKRQEIATSDFEWKESEEGLEFSFELELIEEVVEKLSQLNEASKLSFGFVNKLDSKIPSFKQEYDYDRYIKEMADLFEISILKDLSPAYENTYSYNGDERVVKTGIAKETVKQMRKKICAKDEKRIQELREYITKKR